MKPIKELPWWNSFREVRDEVKPLAEAIDRWADQEIEVCWAHGDFTHRNICQVRNEVWLFDWENSSPDAPLITDELRFFWSTQSRGMIENPAKLASALGRRFLAEGGDRRQRNLALALAFLCTRTQGGIVCGRNWCQLTQGRY